MFTDSLGCPILLILRCEAKPSLEGRNPVDAAQSANPRRRSAKPAIAATSTLPKAMRRCVSWPGAEIAAGQRQHAALDRELFRHRRGGFAREWVADIGEIGADRSRPAIPGSARARGGRSSARRCISRRLSSRHAASASMPQASARWPARGGQIWMQSRIFASSPITGASAVDCAEAVARDAVGLREAVELDDALAPARPRRRGRAHARAPGGRKSR